MVRQGLASTGENSNLDSSYHGDTAYHIDGQGSAADQPVAHSSTSGSEDSRGNGPSGHITNDSADYVPR